MYVQELINYVCTICTCEKVDIKTAQDEPSRLSIVMGRLM